MILQKMLEEAFELGFSCPLDVKKQAVGNILENSNHFNFDRLKIFLPLIHRLLPHKIRRVLTPTVYLSGSSLLKIILGFHPILENQFYASKRWKQDSDWDLFSTTDNLQDTKIFLENSSLKRSTYFEKKIKLSSFVLEDPLFGEIKVDFITNKKFTNAFNVIDTFDLGICQFALDNRFLYATKQALIDLENGQVTLIAKNWSEKTSLRARKYCSRGFEMSSKLPHR